MSTRCKVCNHAQRDEIDKRLVAGEFTTALFREFGFVNHKSLARHRAKHLPAVLVEAKKATELASADGLLEFVEELRTSALAILREAQAGYTKVLGFTSRDGAVVKTHVRDHELALEAIDRLTRLVELLAKVQGQLPAGPTVNIWVNPEWQQLRAVILRALVPYPDARFAVAAALSGAQQGAISGGSNALPPASVPLLSTNQEPEASDGSGLYTPCGPESAQ